MKVRKSLDYTLESLAIVSKIISGDDILEPINKYIDNKGIERDIYNRFVNFTNFINNLKINIPSIIMKYESLFKHIFSSESFMLEFYCYISVIENKSFEEKKNEFFLSVFLELLDEEIKDLDLNKFILYIDKIEVDNSFKFNMIQFYVNGKNIYNEIMKGLKVIEEELKKFYYLIDGDVNNFIYELENKKVTDLNDIFNSDFFKDEDYDVTVSAILYNRLSLTKIDVGNKIYIGYLIYDIIEAKEKSGEDEKKLASILKVLSEPTRFKILKLLKERNMYIQEISRELGLTSATLVHHIELLISQGLVEIVASEEDKKKIYYRLNTNTIKNLLIQMERTLI